MIEVNKELINDLKRQIDQEKQHNKPVQTAVSGLNDLVNSQDQKRTNQAMNADTIEPPWKKNRVYQPQTMKLMFKKSLPSSHTDVPRAVPERSSQPR
jgi:hypothetical protein